MEQKRNNDTPKDQKQRFPSGGFNYSWIYLLFFGFLLAFSFFSSPISGAKEVSWTFLQDSLLTQNKISKIIVVNREFAEIYLKKSTDDAQNSEDTATNLFSTIESPQYRMTIGSIENFESKLEKAQSNFLPSEKIDIRYQNRTNWFTALSWILPIAILILFWLYMFKRMGNGGGMGGSMMNIGKSTAKLVDKGTTSAVTFDDVAGLKEAKTEVMEVVDFLKHPETYTKLGAKIPKGVMLVGPPGTGKTLIAKAVAGEAQVPFFTMSGSEFVEMFVGVGASRVRDLFKRAKEKTPSIVFIDEIDAIGRSRGKGNSFQTNDERESTLNQLLTELDGFGPNTGVIVLAATNRPDILDKALLRPGRFDRHIYLELPTKEEREEIFKVHLKPLKLAKDVDVTALAKLSPGFSGADIANICNEAALIAARKKKDLVHFRDFMAARDRIVGGMERKSKIISQKEKETVAHHEAGHAVVSWYLKNVDSLVKVSIIPRGKSLGAAWYLPEERQIVTKSQFMDQMCASLGGRAAEEIVFNEISSGALDDLEKTTKQAYAMVSYYGLNKKVGPLSFYDSSGQNDRIIGKPYSESMAQLIDTQVQATINGAYERTKALLQEHREELEELAQHLLQHEVAEKEDLERILGKRGTHTTEKNNKHDDPQLSIINNEV
ncbi:ATP-dependent zinc metalloprotease FtsH [Pseudozobellia thermophila]|uniref:ATP-dependent zinc metalloprotease FtsH n=1 Tax=Pseudozobellia thermophila TaxID=192903 RepID=A0A1M6GC99_9FLAO|nr:ATP-dependent zinc metalloprotease FtsH [Pseudozobellia thermophila]SHJ07536.1 cell division protease FtsH [Pseudozobellia thermophila]